VVKRSVLAVLLLALGLVAAACGSHGDRIRHTPEPTEGYVALGDSYTSAPGVGGGFAATGLPACEQSDQNYPHLVAKKLGLKLTDVSCGGARTDHMWDPQKLGKVSAPPQFDALSSKTKVVSIGIGGNDHSVFAEIMGGCVTLAAKQPHGSPCTDLVGKDVAGALETYRSNLAGRLTDVMKGIAKRAPNARVLVIGYPQIVPAHGHCSQLPLATGDYAYVRRITEALDGALKDAADRAGATYVDVWSATEGHDICGHPAWIGGAHPLETSAPYHPYAAEQQAVADLIVRALRG